MAEPTLSSPHHHLFLRRGKCAGLELSSNHSSPTFPSATTLAPDGRRTGHLSTCCSQGKVQLPPLSGPIPSIDSCLKGRIPALKDPACFGYFDAFTIDSAHSRRPESCRQSAPNLCQNRAHLPGRGHRHSTWTRRRRQSHTKIYFDQAQFYVAYRQSLGEGTCIGQSSRRLGQRVGPAPLPTSWPRPTHPQPYYVEHQMAMLICDSNTNTGDRGPQDLILQVHGDRCPDGRPKYQIRKVASTSTFLFARSTKLGHSLPKDRDEEEGDAENGDGELSRSLLFAYYLHKRDEYFSIPHCTQRAFLAFVMTDTPRSRPIDSTYLQLDQENLRLTTGQGIISLTPDQVGCSVILGSTFKNRPRENTQRYQDDMTPSNRPELLARAFEAKLNRLCDDNVFGNKQRVGCL
ncbi:BQ5605_C005g03651 [Microbotryum silenes-dioicae]|uniref:BQ5605_C005g03651 protein n=1 Tax=Microbotryum silenes-dioicae TaxID=796604 RepID=A0A2X0MEN0_9BASI|nr:BQ5605_C005g03651 [Microbotryum silenes-dioicae]